MNHKTLLVHLTLSLAVIGMQTAVADYVAYSIGSKEKSPLPAKVEKIDTKYLLNIEWRKFSGRKTRLGVLKVDNNSSATSFTVSSAMGNIDYSASTAGVPVDGIEAFSSVGIMATSKLSLATSMPT